MRERGDAQQVRNGQPCRSAHECRRETRGAGRGGGEQQRAARHPRGEIDRQQRHARCMRRITEHDRGERRIELPRAPAGHRAPVSPRIRQREPQQRVQRGREKRGRHEPAPRMRVRAQRTIVGRRNAIDMHAARPSPPVEHPDFAADARIVRVVVVIELDLRAPLAGDPVAPLQRHLVAAEIGDLRVVSGRLIRLAAEAATQHDQALADLAVGDRAVVGGRLHRARRIDRVVPARLEDPLRHRIPDRAEVVELIAVAVAVPRVARARRQHERAIRQQLAVERQIDARARQDRAGRRAGKPDAAEPVRPHVLDVRDRAELRAFVEAVQLRELADDRAAARLIEPAQVHAVPVAIAVRQVRHRIRERELGVPLRRRLHVRDERLRQRRLVFLVRRDLGERPAVGHAFRVDLHERRVVEAARNDDERCGGRRCGGRRCERRRGKGRGGRCGRDRCCRRCRGCRHSRCRRSKRRNLRHGRRSRRRERRRRRGHHGRIGGVRRSGRPAGGLERRDRRGNRRVGMSGSRPRARRAEYARARERHDGERNGRAASATKRMHVGLLVTTRDTSRCATRRDRHARTHGRPRIRRARTR
ncbi:hypothetical protein BURPS1710b_A1126 [Burkholderia pseudomallei 1710b]|uniref:Uncharacterized protein n=1 Tax=Burkholderia pseudomallei (strain 1710b) TaxID=320372 RepID=Q3JJG9_BURP1|nr:hypothetical protein BURPS1710b_A1126 [Burkholderia pseudomallei 1710b]